MVSALWLNAPWRRRSELQPQQCSEPLAHIGNDVGWSLRLERESPRLPIEVLDVIGGTTPEIFPPGVGYHASPTSVPQSLSPWRFRGVILATSCFRL